MCLMLSTSLSQLTVFAFHAMSCVLDVTVSLESSSFCFCCLSLFVLTEVTMSRMPSLRQPRRSTKTSRMEGESCSVCVWVCSNAELNSSLNYDCAIESFVTLCPEELSPCWKLLQVHQIFNGTVLCVVLSLSAWTWMARNRACNRTSRAASGQISERIGRPTKISVAAKSRFFLRPIPCILLSSVPFVYLPSYVLASSMGIEYGWPWISVCMPSPAVVAMSWGTCLSSPSFIWLLSCLRLSDAQVCFSSCSYT